MFNVTPHVTMTDLATFLINSFVGTCIVDHVGITSRKGGFSTHTMLSAVTKRKTSSLVFFPLTFNKLVPIDRLTGVVLIRIMLGALCRMVMLPMAIHIIGCVGQISSASMCSRRVSCGVLEVGRVWRV